MVYELTDKDNNKALSAHKDDRIAVTLAWKPSTGFCWQESTDTAGVIERIDHDADPVPGGTSYVKFVFRVVKTGVITLDYAQPFGENQPPSKWFAVTVNCA